MRRKRQAADAAAGRGEQRVGDRRGDHRHADFAQPARFTVAVDKFYKNLGALRQFGQAELVEFARGRDAAVIIGRRRSEEHTSELQSLMRISYAVFCLKTKTQNTITMR